MVATKKRKRKKKIEMETKRYSILKREEKGKDKGRNYKGRS